MDSPDVPTLSVAWEQAHKFSYQAMATTFELLIAGHEQYYAAQAAMAAFDLLEHLEKRYLSRFSENSDIHILNEAPVNVPVLVAPDTYACLEQARVLHEWTAGAFDVTVGQWTQETPVSKPRQQPEGFGLALEKGALTATRLHEVVTVDLGGIGKGYALDVMADQLERWSVTQVVLHGGGSTILARQGPEEGAGWPVTLSDPHNHQRLWKQIFLSDQALAGSAQITRHHIVDPQTGRKITDRDAAWALAPNGAWADGLSTAFMIMSPAAIQKLCAQQPKLAAAVVASTTNNKASSGDPQYWGHWS